MKHQHIAPCSCIGTCSVVIITEWDDADQQPEDWYLEFFQHIQTRKGFKDRWRVFWGVMRGRDPYTHGVILQTEEIAGLRDFLNERTGVKGDRAAVEKAYRLLSNMHDRDAPNQNRKWAGEAREVLRAAVADRA